jgi:hypothetical protein
VNHLVRPWRRRVARVLVLALAFGTVPIVCLAGPPPGPSSPASPIAASADKAVQHDVGQIAKASPNVARQSTANAQASGGFFKSKAGVITIVLLAAGTGFALYSTSHDRVKSPQVTYGGTWK